MRIDPIIKALLKHDRAFERLQNGDILVRASSCPDLGLELGDSSSNWNPTPEQIEVASWFDRRPSTEWSKRERAAWLPIKTLFDFTSDDWSALKWYYTQSKCPYLRKDLGTLLNNWQGEIDRAKQYDPSCK